MTNNYFKLAQEESSKWFWIKKLYLSRKVLEYSYIRYRFLRPILKGYYKLFNLFYPGRPWTTPASILFFEKALTKDMTGLEYGSGRSTLFFAKKLNKLVSIEHYAGWYEKVKKNIEDKGITNVDYHLIPKQNTADAVEDTKEALLKLDGHESRDHYANYYNKVNEYPDEYFDFVLIDGRARVKCGLNAMNKLKSGGIFVLDNSERTRYAPLRHALMDWPHVNTTTGLTNTTIWIKP